MLNSTTSAPGLGLIDHKTRERGVAGLRLASGQDGVFRYTFFKAMAFK